MKLNYRLSSFLMILILCPIFGQSQKVKEVSKEYGALETLDISHRYGDLNVHKSSSKSTRIDIKISATGDPADVETFLNHVEINESKSGDRVSLATKIESKRWNNNNGRIKVTFKDGSKVSDIREFKVTYDVYVGHVDQLSLKNKYRNIHLEDLDCQTAVELYDGDLFGGDINNTFDLSIKYGKADIGHTGDAHLKLYDSNLKMVNAKAIDLESKYSEVNIDDCSSLEVKSYDDEISVGNIAGNLHVEDKYSEYEITSCRHADLKFYDAKLKINDAESIDISSKYSEYKINKSGSVEIDQSYDDTFLFQQLDAFACDQSKYSHYEINLLSNTLRIESYDDQVEVREIGAAFKELEMTGKYTKLEIPMESLSGYVMDAEGKHGKIIYNQDRFQVTKHIETSSDFIIRGTSGSGQAKVSLNLYDCTVRFQ